MSTTMAVKTLSSCIKQLNQRGFVELSESGKKVTGLTNLAKRIQNNLNNVWDSSFLKQRPVVKLSSVATADPNQTLPDVSSSEVTSGSGFQFESNVPTISACEQDKLQSFFCVPLTHRKVVLCCSPETSFNFYNAIQRNRYQWWRKLARSSANFELKTHAKDSSIKQHSKICCSPKSVVTDGAPLTMDVESVAYITDKQIVQQHLGHSTDCHLVWIETLMEVGTLSYLLDGLTEKTTWLNNELVAHHIAIVIEKSPISHYLQEYCDYLVSELKNDNYSTYFPDDIEQDKLYEHLDKRGVRYAVIINENLKRGILKLRDRDTKLLESVHVSRIKDQLQAYFDPDYIVKTVNARTATENVAESKGT